MLLRNYKFRIYPSKSQQTLLEQQLESCRVLYNSALEQRIWFWRNRRKSVTYYDQQNELPTLKREFPEYKNVHSQVLQNVLNRLDKTFKSFFRRVKLQETPGFPRFKSRDRYNSFTYPQSGFPIDESTKRINLSKIGKIKIKQWRTLPGKFKQCTIRREPDGWYVVLCCEIEPNLLPTTNKKIGLDVGIKSLVTDSNGLVYGSIRQLQRTEREIRKYQKAHSRKKKGSRRKMCSRQLLARKHQKLRRKRKYALHQISRTIINENDLIALEDLDIKQMIKKPPRGINARGLRRNIHQAAWGQLRAQIVYKAEEAGRQVVCVNPRNTTQNCSCCGTKVPKTLRDRIHKCPDCGLVLDRDHNAAINILQRALRVLRRDPGSLSGPVKREGQSKELCMSAQQH